MRCDLVLDLLKHLISNIVQDLPRNLRLVLAEQTLKILLDATVPLRPPRVSTVQLPEEGSAGLAAKKIVGDDVTVVSAFQNVGAAHLREDDAIETDVLVTGESAEARETVVRLVEAAGMRGWQAGPLVNSVAAEALTSVLIGINRRYEIGGAGIRITGGDHALSVRNP